MDYILTIFVAVLLFSKEFWKEFWIGFIQGIFDSIKKIKIS